MAGHSKWANIRFKKAAQDAKRGKIFTKLIREITVAARMGGGDPAQNPRLRDAIDKALKANMKRDTIEKATSRGAGNADGGDMFELRYEGYGPGGIAVLVDTLTDNKNRTVGEVRHAFSKCGGNLGTDGSVAYLFEKKGIITYAAEVDEDQLMEAALDAGAEDVVTNDDNSKDVFTTAEDFYQVKEALVASFATEPERAELDMSPSTRVSLDQDSAEKLLKLIDMLEELDDVQNVYSNADISYEILEALAS